MLNILFVSIRIDQMNVLIIYVLIAVRVMLDVGLLAVQENKLF